MEIETGRLMDKSVIKRLLIPIPKKYLKSIDKIKVTTIPHKGIRERERHWGGMWGTLENKTIFIFLYAITEDTNNRLNRFNNNWYHLAIEDIARTLYFEIASANKNLLKNRFKPTIKELKRTFFKPTFANNFEEYILRKAYKKNVLSIPTIKKIRFLKMFRDKYINRHMEVLRKSGGRYNAYFPVIDHLRKCSVGLDYKYNLHQLFDTLHPNLRGKYISNIMSQFDEIHLNVYAKTDYCNETAERLLKRDLYHFKRHVLEIVKGKYYTSKKRRKYVFFTDRDLEKVSKRLRWKPKLYTQKEPLY